MRRRASGLDLVILLRTVPAVLRRGAAGDGPDGGPSGAVLREGTLQAPQRLARTPAAAGARLRRGGGVHGVSRLTGVLRCRTVGAVLGPTLLGNAYQVTNTLPNLV